MRVKSIIKIGLCILLLILGIWAESLLPFVGIAVLIDSVRTNPYLRSVWHYLKRKLTIWFKYFEWTVAIILALWVVVFVQNNFIGIYTFHTSSMHQTLQVGDVLLVNKLIPGPRHSCNQVSSYGRSKGMASLSYNDAIVFNFPEADTLLESRPTESYHYLKRLYGEGGFKLKDKTNLKYLDVKDRPRFVKRVYGLPGDSIEIVNGICYANGATLAFPEESIDRYIMDKETVQLLNEKNIQPYNEYTSDKGIAWEILQKDYDNIKGFTKGIRPDHMLKNLPDPLVFPFDSHLLWNMHNMGPVYIPRKGAKIKLTEKNLQFYGRAIEVFEQNELKRKDGKVWLNGEMVDEYTFKMNYYWVIGDNRPHSFDSRFWGFVPQNHIIGKVKKILLSRDINKKGWIYLRKDRFLKKVD
ncbi:signal peptidase I [Saccharicrinis sp. 156]|uniref:signal peptidase I n=1 Tax=Saccharicrinis sp. 156 TaxID=3417574 RepID=UPI003D337E6E